MEEQMQESLAPFSKDDLKLGIEGPTIQAFISEKFNHRLMLANIIEERDSLRLENKILRDKNAALEQHLDSIAFELPLKRKRSDE